MSLDVYLVLNAPQLSANGSGIFVRESGATVEILREEWDAKFPEREPVIAERREDESGEVYWRNITHNLGEMAREAGIYQHLWRPDEINITKAEELIAPLNDGLHRLRKDSNKFEAFNPDNGWGTYDGFVAFVEDYLKACQTYPNASVHVSR